MNNNYRLWYIFFLALLIIPFASAYEFDNIVSDREITKDTPIVFKDTTIAYKPIMETYKPIAIDNAFGMGKLLVEGAITEHTSVCGTDCETQFTICNYQDTPAIDGVEFYRIMDDGKRVLSNIRSYQWWVKTSEKEIVVKDYQNICSNIGFDENGSIKQDCENKLIGTHIEVEPIWEKYNYEVKNGCYDYKLTGQKRVDLSYDFIPIISGKKIDSWADWFGFGGKTQYIANITGTTSMGGTPHVGAKYNMTTTVILRNVSIFGVDTAINATGIILKNNAGVIINSTTIDSKGVARFYNQLDAGVGYRIEANYSAGASIASVNASLKKATLPKVFTDFIVYNVSYNGADGTFEDGWIAVEQIGYDDITPNFTVILNSPTTAWDNDIITFELNISSLDINTIYNNTNATLNYLGSVYSPDLIDRTNQNYTYFKKTLTIPYIGNTTGNLTSYSWDYNLNNATANPYLTGSKSNSVTIYSLIFGPCSATNTWKVLNLTFVDETTGLPINATMDTSSWTYSYRNISKSFTFANATVHNYKYDFCVSPQTISSFKSTETLQYSHSETGTYPQRKITFTNDTYYNSTLTTKVLYLLNTNNGITSNYQVITVGNQVIAGAHISISRVINGNDTQISDGYTDSSGQISFFLNPNYDHTFTVSATGFASQTQTLKPTQSQYTFTMGTQSTYFQYTSSLEGISYSIFPPSGLIQDGMYNFTFQVFNEITNNIYNCTMNLYYPNGTWLNGTTGCNSVSPGTGGKISLMINTTLLSSFNGEYYITLPNNTIYYLERDARWVNVHFTESNGSSLADAIRDLIALPEWGDCPVGYNLNATDDRCYDAEGNMLLKGQTADFSRIVFFFLFIAILLAILNFYTGYDTAYPGAFLVVVTGLVFIGSWVNGISGPGFFYLEGAVNNSFFFGFGSIINNWILFVHFLLLLGIYFFTTNKRYQSG